MPDKIKLLYDTVSKDYDLGSFDDFSKKLQDPTKRKAFYDGVGAEYQLGSYSDFETKIGGKKKCSQFYTWIKNIWTAFRNYPTE